MFGVLTYILILTALILGALRKPPIAVAAVLCLYGLKQWGQDTSAFLATHGQLTNFVVGSVTLVAVIQSAVRGRREARRISGVEWLVLALYLYALVSVSWAPDWSQSLEQWTKQGPYIITVLLLAPVLLTDFEAARSALTWTAFTGGYICAVALLLGHWGSRGLLIYGDATESETNPLALASLAGTAFIVSALSLSRANSMRMRLTALCCIPLSLGVILRSGSRGQLLAAGAGLLIAAPIAFRPKGARAAFNIVIAGILIVALGVWASTLVAVDAERWSKGQSEEQVGGRVSNAAKLLSATASDPATAVFGLGNSASFEVIGFYPHITVVEVLAEEGVLGIVLYLSALVLTCANIWRMRFMLRERDVQTNTLAMLAGLFVFEFVLSCKQGSLLSSVYVLAYAITLARMSTAGSLRAASGPPAIAIGGAPRPRFSNLLR